MNSHSKSFRTRCTLMSLCLMLCISMLLPSTALAAESDPADVFEEYVTVGEDGRVSVGSTNQGGTLGGIVTTYKSIAATITGILTVTMLICLLVQFVKLGAAGDNEAARKRASMGILTTGIATALLGGATIVIGFLWTVITNAVE